jgi:putative transcriptional regulator
VHQLGFITKRKMQQYDALCVSTAPDFDTQNILALREQHQLSQTLPAAMLNPNLSTVRKWELGNKHPSG